MRYSLNSTEIPRPSYKRREYINIENIYTSINGRTTRDYSARKEMFILGYQYLSQSEIDTLNTIIALNQAVAFEVADGNLVINSTNVFPYIAKRRYPVPGGSYIEAVELELIEES